MLNRVENVLVFFLELPYILDGLVQLLERGRSAFGQAFRERLDHFLGSFFSRLVRLAGDLIPFGVADYRVKLALKDALDDWVQFSSGELRAFFQALVRGVFERLLQLFARVRRNRVREAGGILVFDLGSSPGAGQE